MSDRVPITVGILTFNSSITTVEATVRSVSEFAEVLVCDGASTDGTRELVVSLGCVLIDQAPEFTDENGRLINMTGVREQMLRAASHDWVFFLDHDELATPELVAEMRNIATRERVHGAYRVPRLYVLGGQVLTCASVYPSYQTRLVYRKAVAQYAGIIHDHPVLVEGETIGSLAAPQLVPQPPLRDLWPKWRGYMKLEEVGKTDLTRAEWIAQVLRPELRMIKWLAYRNITLRRDCSGPRLPMRYEFARMAYEAGVIFYTGRRFIGLGRADPHAAWK